MYSKDILIVGSIAFDILFSIENTFQSAIHVEDNKINNFNASYLAKDKLEMFWWAGANIAVWLWQENINSTLFTAYWKDLHTKKYMKKLDFLNIDIKWFQWKYSATAYMLSDKNKQQLMIWQPNSSKKVDTICMYNYLTEDELKGYKLVIFAPWSEKSIVKDIVDFKKINKTATVIFDPGQTTPRFSKEDFLTCCEHSNIIIWNDSEFKFFNDFWIPEHLTKIETLGENWVNIKTPKWENIDINWIKVKNVIETTWAWDAFRAWMLSWLIKWLSLKESAKIWVKLGAECVTLPSAQKKADY